jgi:PBSX family phage terminase large subunit
VIAGIQSGKTFLGAVWLTDRIQRDYQEGKKGDYLICAPTIKILNQSTLPKFLEVFPKDWGTYKAQRQCFDLAWGNKIYVRSADEPEHLEGMTLRSAWLDEVGQMVSQVWTNIQGRLSIHQGSCIMTTTPYSMGWFFRDIYKKAASVCGNPDSDIEVFTWDSVENPHFPKEEYERARATMLPALFERRYQGKFTQLEGLVYPQFGEEHILEPFPIPGNWTNRFAGVDFGHTAPTAIVCIAENPETHEFVQYRELYRSGLLLKEIADFLLHENYRTILADPSDAQNIDELSRFYGVKGIKPADNRVGTERISSLLTEKRLKVFSSCEKTIGEFELYHYPNPDMDKVFKDRPVAKNNHAMDALKYAFSKPQSGLYPAVTRTTLEKRSKLQNRRLPVNDYWTGY